MTTGAGNDLFRERLQVARGLRNSWLLNFWRMRRHTDDGVSVDYFVRGNTVVVTRIKAAFGAE